MDERNEKIVEQVGRMRSADRLRLFYALRERFCLECGADQPEKGRRCQCENDE